MVRSWWRRAVILLIAILMTTGFFFGWTSYSYSHQLQQTIESENRNSVNLWTNMTTSRLGTLYEHIYELLLTLYNNTELRTDTPIMNALTKQKIVEIMEDKLLVSEDADAFFVYDAHNDFYLFSADTNRDTRALMKMKAFVYENAVSYAEPFRSLSWRIVTIGERNYFFKSVQLGKYIVGVMSNLDYYHIDKDFSVLGENVSFRLLVEDVYYSCGGIQEPEDQKNAVTVTGEVELLGGMAVLTAYSDSLWDGSASIQFFLLLDSALCLILVVLLLLMLRKNVATPTKALIRANHALASGDTAFRLETDAAGSTEFCTLYDSFNEMSEQIVQLRIQAYDLKIREEKNKLTMLRAQIRPHSFLNAITTISNMTYTAKPEDIRSYISTFAKFIRYMLNVSAPWTTVGDEIRQISNYLAMQQGRFPGSVLFRVDCPEELSGRKIPFLILYTLVENSIKHAMTLYETLHISVQCRRVETETFRGICLIQEDDGGGFPEDVLKNLQQESSGELNTKEHLGLSNVRYTLHLVYRRGDLLRISNRETGGAHVEIWIPDEEEA